MGGRPEDYAINFEPLGGLIGRPPGPLGCDSGFWIRAACGNMLRIAQPHRGILGEIVPNCIGWSVSKAPASVTVATVCGTISRPLAFKPSYVFLLRCLLASALSAIPVWNAPYPQPKTNLVPGRAMQDWRIWDWMMETCHWTI